MSIQTNQAVEYNLAPNGDFVIGNYQQKKTFSSFLSGIAGPHGIPLWVFYVNRGQGIASFGLGDKDHAMMEFEPANKAYQNVPTKGFRTLIKTLKTPQPALYEPFRRVQAGVDTKMIISLSTLTIEEVASSLGLKTRIQYFILPEEPFGALVRKVSIRNLIKTPQTLEVLDGMPIVIPSGLSNQALKETSQTVSAWARVYGLAEKTAFYRTAASIADSTEVETAETGNFFFSFRSTEEGNELLMPLVEPELIFAEDTSLDQPLGFLRQELSTFAGFQITANRFPCAMGAVQKELAPDEELTICSVFGFLPQIHLLPAVRDRVLAPGYLEKRQAKAAALHDYYADHCLTVCNDPRFTYYTRQTYLDNFLRGGFSLNLGGTGKKTPYYVFSRKHGDLERDYNYFKLAPTFYSHGNGNFRDVLQNRRCDNFFNAHLKATNIKTFASLLQPDGFNPLVIKGTTYLLTDQATKELALRQVAAADRARLEQLLGKPFSPGAIATLISAEGIKLSTPLPDFLGLLIEKAHTWTAADFGEGYWIDHWTYLLDLIQTYLALYPEELTQLLSTDQTYTFYDSGVKILPRSKKYVLTGDGPRQTAALSVDPTKTEMIEARADFPHAVRVEKGHGEIYHTNLLGILFTLVLNKLSSLDPHGVGLEMEAGKPGWYDAMNGLPGLFGSATPETMELLRLVRFLDQALTQLATGVASAGGQFALAVPTEIYDFYQGLAQLLTAEVSAADLPDRQSCLHTNRPTPVAAMKYWAAASTLREQYRETVFFGFAGTEQKIAGTDLHAFFRKAAVKLETAVAAANNRENGLFDTYYTNLPSEYRLTGELSPDGLPYLEATAFSHHPLPLFLEGQVRALKILDNREAAQRLHENIARSPLYDQTLEMYRVNADLSSEPFTIGRARAFSPGWLENGSIWLHMEYKYLLALLQSGLIDEFYGAAQSSLIPYLNPEVYGRSILENSSFILSSVNQDQDNHGRGYIARLSGSTAEFLSIWAFLSFGAQPFRWEETKLCFAPQPFLRSDFFTVEPQEVKFQFNPTHSETLNIPANTYAYRFLGASLVVYHNPKRGDTFGPCRVNIQGFRLRTAEGKVIELEGNIVPSPLAEEIRAGMIPRIDVFFA